MDLDSWEDSDLEFRASTPIFTSDDEHYPPPLASPTRIIPIVNEQPLKLRLVAPRASSTRGFGQRKLRRYENDFFFLGGHLAKSIPKEWGLAGMNPTMASLCAQLEALELTEHVQLCESIFSRLKKVDAALLDAFFEGENVTLKRNKPLLLDDRPTNSKRGSSSSEQAVEDAFQRIDKKSRKHLLRATDFVRGLENVLLDNGRVLDGNLVERITGESKSKSETIFMSLDSSFLRLLAHGVAQFYGVQSRSIRATDGSHQVQFNLNKSLKPGIRLSTYLDGKNTRK